MSPPSSLLRGVRGGAVGLAVGGWLGHGHDLDPAGGLHAALRVGGLARVAAWGGRGRGIVGQP